MIDVELVGVEVEVPGNPPNVVLAAVGEPERQLSIFIGAAEAQSIAFAVKEVEFPRPLTHDLMVDVFDALGVEVEQVVITEIRGTTFFAELTVRGEDGVRTVSARPSDAIALAVRVGCPIRVSDEVMEQAGVTVVPDLDIDPDEVVEEFRNFIDNVDPEDFAS